MRVDVAGDHEYRSAPWSPAAPTVPYAVYLADQAGRYRLLCWDLDASAGPDVVAEDLATLCELLDETSWRYVVAVSGPTGGRHVWAYVPEGVDGDQVAELARGLAAILPSLDTSMWNNPATGCARPPGAPHRAGGASRLDPDRHPDTAAAVAQLAAGNPPERVAQLYACLPPAVRESAAARAGEHGRQYRTVVDDGAAPRLAGERRALSPAIAALVTSRPAAGDWSAQLWRILVGAALARWSLVDVAELARDPAAVGLEHLRSRHVAGVRHPRTPQQAAEVLARQWRRAVDRAAELAPNTAPDDADRDDDPRVREVTAAVATIHHAAEAMPWRWRTPGGPADRDALRTVCRLALAACSLTIALDVRRWSELTGYAASTMSLAARRLCRTDPVDGPAWLAQETPAAGRQAAVWRLVVPDVDEHQDQAAADDVEQDPQSAAASSVDEGRTQGRSPRPPSGPAFPPPSLTRESLDEVLAARQAHAAHDAWHPHGGLGHHTARTHAALQAGPQTLQELTQATGYTPATVRQHVDQLERVGLATTSTTGQIRPGRRSLDAVARQLGTAGAGARRRARHLVDRELRTWWEDELTWRRTPKADKPRIPRRFPGQRTAAVAVDAGSLATFGRFPTRAGTGRADYTAAAAIVRAHLAANLPGQRAAA